MRFWLPVYLYAALIFFLSSIPKPLPDSIEVPFLDKFLHAAEYGVLGYLIARAFGNSARRSPHLSFHFLAVAITILYGTADEIHQAFVPNRMTSGWDVVFDGIGAFIGVYLFNKKRI